MKCRVWDTKKNEWVKDFALVNGRVHPLENPTGKLREVLQEYDRTADYALIDFANWYNENYVVEWSNGVEDMHMNPIYQNDLIIIDDGDLKFRVTDLGINSVRAEGWPGTDVMTVAYSDSSKVKIIGNIHEGVKDEY